MGWIDSLRGQKVGLDTSPFIYYTEEAANYFGIVDAFFEAIGRGEIAIVTSVVTLLEVLIYPTRNGDAELANRYRDLLFKTKGIKTLLLDQDIAEEAARLRAFHNVRTPDAIQMATAISEGAKFFLTNDKRLPSLPNLTILVLDDLVSDRKTEEPS